ncbi:hypothetical protein DE146DRAFT_757161 [Phaeosphaeria sp. MPI-PUGE-AT-0046c]|nr:hypothetical protein DE146DRAFT_757161 [Phaeosphaeria sp. MPI-PUGE-AT-0046c]
MPALASKFKSDWLGFLALTLRPESTPVYQVHEACSERTVGQMSDWFGQFLLEWEAWDCHLMREFQGVFTGSVYLAMRYDYNQHLSKDVLEEEILENLSVNGAVFLGDGSRRGQGFEAESGMAVSSRVEVRDGKYVHNSS